MDWRFEDTNIWYVIIMQMLATKSQVVSTTQHNQTQQQLVVKVEYIGKKNVLLLIVRVVYTYMC